MLVLKYSGRVEFFFQKLNRRKRVAKNVALYRTAALVRTTARRMIRVSPNPARPTFPVHSRTRGGLRTIMFSVSSTETSAIIGPIKFYGSDRWDEPQPHIHEFGGTFVNMYRHFFARYPKRPYMSKTLEKLNKQGIIPRQFALSLARII